MVQSPRAWTPEPSGGRDAAIFFTWAALCVAAFGCSWWVARGHKDVSGFLLVPLIAAFLCYDNLALAIDALNSSLVSTYEPALAAVPGAADASEGEVVVGLQRVRAAVQAFIIPLLLVTGAESWLRGVRRWRARSAEPWRAHPAPNHATHHPPT